MILFRHTDIFTGSVLDDPHIDRKIKHTAKRRVVISYSLRGELLYNFFTLLVRALLRIRNTIYPLLYFESRHLRDLLAPEQWLYPHFYCWIYAAPGADL